MNEIREEEGSVIAANDLNQQMPIANINPEDKFLAWSIQGKLVQQPPSPPCIFRMPKILQGPSEIDYVVPKLVSIGPYHHGEKNLEPMERIKLWYSRCLLDRTATPETSLEHLVNGIRAIEQACRNCYDSKSNLSSDEFVEMMVVDGCFIVEFMLKTEGRECLTDSMTENLWTRSPLVSDLLLLENQLPWLALDCLFQLIKGNTLDESVGQHVSLSKLTHKFTQFCAIGHLESSGEAYEISHLLDYMRNSIVGRRIRLTILTVPPYLFPCVTELLQLGVKFKARESSCNLLNITFRNGVMEMPQIFVHKNESVFLNLIALEQCEQGRIGYEFNSYARILHYLIKSSKDAEFLMQKGIVRTRLSKEDIARFFTSVCNSTTFASQRFADLSREVHLFWKERTLQRCLISIKRDYLYNPSSIWSISNAVFLIIILTFIQTLYSVLSYHK